MIGDASMVSPIAEGMVSKKASRIPRARIARNSSILPIAALFATSGSVTVPMATPKIPSGNCINRKAILSQLTGPLPTCGEATVDEDVHLHGAGRDHCRSHQREHSAHAFVAPLKIGAIPVPDMAQ